MLLPFWNFYFLIVGSISMFCVVGAPIGDLNQMGSSLVGLAVSTFFLRMENKNSTPPRST